MVDPIAARPAVEHDAVERQLVQLEARLISELGASAPSRAACSASVCDGRAVRGVPGREDVHRGPDAARPGRPGFDLRFIGLDGTQQREADLVLVSNNAYRLRRIAGFGTRERMDQGVLAVTAVTVDRGGDLAALVAAEGRWTGRPVPRLPGVDRPGVPDRVRLAAARRRRGRRGVASAAAPGLPIAAGRATHPDTDERWCLARGGTPGE